MTFQLLRILRHSIPALLLLLLVLAGAQASDAPGIPREVGTLLEKNCYSCHGPEKQKGKVRLDTLAALTGDAREDLLNAVQEEVYFEKMPPEEDTLSAAERKLVKDWVANELKAFGPSKLEDKLRRPDYGNHLDHDKLFSGEHKDLKGFTYDRRWLISEYIFDAKFNRILEINIPLDVDGKRVPFIGRYTGSGSANLTNPFLLPTEDGVRYYANEMLSGGHLLTMLTNAKVASTVIMDRSRRSGPRGAYLPALASIMNADWEREKTLAARDAFLNNFIEQLLMDLYKEKNSELLPKFVPLAADASATVETTATKKAPFHSANPGNAEMILISNTMAKFEGAVKSDAELIDMCERDWFNWGHNQRLVFARLTFMRNYMEDFRKSALPGFRKNNRIPPFKALAAAEMTAINDAIQKNRRAGDTYSAIIGKCVEQWAEENRLAREKEGAAPPEKIATLVDQVFVKILDRSPDPDEAKQYLELTQKSCESLGNQQGILKLIQTVLLRTDFVYRREFGEGTADESGRKMMSPRDASYALAYALTDNSPDKELAEAAKNGKLNTREDYKREVERMLKRRDQYYQIDESISSKNVDSFTNMPIRKLRFFREFFGYPNLLPIFKDNKRFGGNYDNAKLRLVSETDQWLDYVLRSDKNVFEQLLTSDSFYVFHSGDNQAMAASSEHIRELHDYFKDKGWQNFKLEDLRTHADFLRKTGMRGINPEDLTPKGRSDPLRTFMSGMKSYAIRFDKGQSSPPPFNAFSAHGPGEANSRTKHNLSGEEVAKCFNIALDNWNYPTAQPAKVENRKGLLTHPAWLIAHAKNTETDPIRRGKWIREKLLAGTVPDVPITVDAVIPEDHHKTLRQRLDVRTKDGYCWNCHQQMNPLGLTFEIFDDFGRFRTLESLEHPDNLVKKNPDKGEPHVDLRDIYKTLPVDAKGSLDGTGDPKLDGDVANAFELIDRLGKSTRVRQSIIRHAFRYFMGRNEMLSDSKTLLDADKAYIDSGGSFDAVIFSLLTSDSFIYRKAQEN